LLIVNGGIVIIGEIIIILEGNLSSESLGGMARNIIFGLLLTGLGIWKIISNRKAIFNG
jgi:hypothetical protein